MILNVYLKGRRDGICPGVEVRSEPSGCKLVFCSFNQPLPCPPTHYWESIGDRKNKAPTWWIYSQVFIFEASWFM